MPVPKCFTDNDYNLNKAIPICDGVYNCINSVLWNPDFQYKL